MPDKNHANKKTHKLFENMRHKISSENRSYEIIFEELYSISKRLRKQVIALSNTDGAGSRAVILAEL
ncbi:MAG: hypothetical protein HDT21_02380 [Ruminococcus sp.]|nr:hypothetical protein [Ruminococcus sp.]